MGRQGADKPSLSDNLAQQLAAQAQQKCLRARPKPRRAAQSAATPGWTHAASSKQAAGMRGEERVCQYLAGQGARILARNLGSRWGEIDIACLDAGVLAFVEVRQRGSTHYGGALASVGRAKRARLMRAAQALLARLVQQHFHGQAPPCRFDVVGLEGENMIWIKQAFTLDAD